jgi:YfiH family protein
VNVRIRRVVTTREGGVSTGAYHSFNLGDHVGDDAAAVAANRDHLAAGIGLSPDRVVWMGQVHGRAVEVVDGPRPEPVPATDGLVTDVAGLAVAVLVADCVPVLLGDPVAGVVAAVHAGRVGAQVGVLTAALAAMQRLGAEPGNLAALLGPAACGQCYEVPPAMQSEVASQLPGSASRTRRGTSGLDLRAGLRRQLADAGVGRIGVDPRCTIEDPALFSYRREGTTGRLAALTWIEPG